MPEHHSILPPLNRDDPPPEPPRPNWPPVNPSRLPPDPRVPLGRGYTGNVLAAIASFFVPGLGQLAQGRFGLAVILMLVAGVVWAGVVLVLNVFAFLAAPFLLLIHMGVADEAAKWRGPTRRTE